MAKDNVIDLKKRVRLPLVTTKGVFIAAHQLNIVCRFWFMII